MIPFLLIVGFWAEGKWIRPSVSVVTRDGSSGNSLVPVNWSKSLRMLGCTHIKRSLPGDSDTVVFQRFWVSAVKRPWCGSWGS